MHDLFGLNMLSGYSNIEASRWAVMTIVEARCLKFQIALRYPQLVGRTRPYLAGDELFSVEETANLGELSEIPLEKFLEILSDYSPKMFALLSQYGLEPVLALEDCDSAPRVVLQYIATDVLELEEVSN